MDKTYFDNLARYSAIMLQADRMRDLGLMTDVEYQAISTKIADNCGLSERCIFRRNNLIIQNSRVNMPATKEVGSCQQL